MLLYLSYINIYHIGGLGLKASWKVNLQAYDISTNSKLCFVIPSGTGLQKMQENILSVIMKIYNTWFVIVQRLAQCGEM